MIDAKGNIQSASDIIELIYQIETDLNPQDWKVNDVDIWPILRTSLYYELSMKFLGKKSTKPKKIQLIKRVFKSILSLFSNFNTHSKVLLVSDGISYLNLNLKLYQRFCDPIIEDLIENNISWDKWDIAGDLRGTKFFESRNINQSLDFLIFKSKFYKLKLNSNKDNFINKLCDFINNKTDLVHWKSNSVEKKIIGICLMIEWYKKQLNPTHVKIALIVSYYSDRGMALIKACKDLGITTADIQHGVQGELHAAYCYWKNAPSKGYNTIPDAFLVWSEREVNQQNNTVVIGNLFENKWFMNDPDVLKMDSEFKTYTENLKANKNILFTLQYGLDYKECHFKLVYETQNNFNWLIRMHPVMTDIEKKEFVKTLKLYGIYNYEIENSSSVPLCVLLRNVNLHITHSSSTVLEALNFRVPTLLIDKFGQEYYKDFLGGTVMFSEDIEEQINLINRLAVNTYIKTGNFKIKDRSKLNLMKFINSKV